MLIGFEKEAYDALTEKIVQTWNTANSNTSDISDLGGDLSSLAGLTDTALAGKSDTGHTHTMSEITDLPANLSEAEKLAAARTISLSGNVTGSGSFDGSGDLDIATVRRGCIVGNLRQIADATYYKFASLSSNIDSRQEMISFKVCRTDDLNSTTLGILTAHFQTTSTTDTYPTSWRGGALTWEYATSGIDASAFILAHNTNISPTVVELWVRCTGYGGYTFDVLTEADRIERKSERWTLYDNISATGGEPEITSGYETMTSSILTLKNPVLIGTATAASEGLMSAADKAKLDAVPSSLAEKQDKAKAVSCTIPTSGWTSDETADYPYYYDISVSDITANDIPHVILSVSGISTAEQCGLCPTCESLSGKIRLRAKSAPTAAITAEYRIEQGKE